MGTSRRKRKERRENFLFTIPSVILVVMMMYIPFVMSGFYSLTQWNGIAKEPVFIGLENFRTIFSGTSDFLPALWFTIRYTLLFVIFSNVIALALAVALTKKFRMANVYRGLFFIPYIMSMTVVGFIWKFIFTSGFKSLYAAGAYGIYPGWEIRRSYFSRWFWLASGSHLAFTLSCTSQDCRQCRPTFWKPPT